MGVKSGKATRGNRIKRAKPEKQGIATGSCANVAGRCRVRNQQVPVGGGVGTVRCGINQSVTGILSDLFFAFALNCFFCRESWGALAPRRVTS